MSQVQVAQTAGAGEARGSHVDPFTEQPVTRAEQRRKLLVFAGALALVAAYPLIHPAVDRALGAQTMLPMMEIALFVILALGLNIVVGFAGLLDLGYVAFFAIGAYTVAFLTSPQSPFVSGEVASIHVPFWLAMALSLVVAGVFGVLLGAPTLRLRGDYLAIVTLAFGEIVPVVIKNLEKWTKGTKGINPIGQPALPGGYRIGDPIPGFTLTVAGNRVNSGHASWYWLVLLVGLLTIFLISRLRDSRLGRAWMAMREDEVAASFMGVNLVQTKLLAFGLGASFSGFSGSIFASMLQVIDPSQFDFSVSIIVLSMVIVGGLGNIWGVIAGGFLMGFFNFFLAPNANNWLGGFARVTNLDFLANLRLDDKKLFIFGLALVLMMVLRPEGLIPSARRKAELRPETEDQASAERQTLYGTSDTGVG
jgi:branched-chain amino acid transport system permease protein